MALVKCPICELNYMNSTDRCCSVCAKQVKAPIYDDETDMCSNCGEHEALPGEELCAECLAEYNKMNGDSLKPTVPISNDEALDVDVDVDVAVTDDIPIEDDTEPVFPEEVSEVLEEDAPELGEEEFEEAFDDEEDPDSWDEQG